MATTTQSRTERAAAKARQVEVDRLAAAVQAVLDGLDLDLAAGYVPCSASDVPADVRFDLERRTAGNMVQQAYGGTGRAEHGYGDPWLRVTDASTQACDYYAWVGRPTLQAVAEVRRVAGVDYLRLRLGSYEVDVQVSPGVGPDDAARIGATARKMADRHNARLA